MAKQNAMPDGPRILIVDDDRFFRDSLSRVLKRAGFAPLIAHDGVEALDTLSRQDVDLMLLDLDMPRRNGIETLRQAAMRFPNVPVIIVSGKGDIPKAVDATRLGAYDFLEKPVEAARILLTVRNTLETVTLRLQRDSLLKEVHERYGMIGSSPAMKRMFEVLDRAARTNVRVLITGENGTGKELVARALHLNSDRAAGPFVPVNCAAVPETLIESEFFGHEKGAFTGAHTARRGIFEQAHGGTLFLDEIGDMSLMTQARLLRVLETSTINRLGSQKSIRIDTRILAATNKDLKTEIEEGNFREDLYYRIKVVHLHLPPLRERWEDIPPLVDAFLDHFCMDHGLPLRQLAPATLVLLSDYGWPGNIRQLRNVVERLIALSDGPIITLEEVEHALEQEHHQPRLIDDEIATLREARKRFERQYIADMLMKKQWRRQETATALGITREHLWKRMQHYGIEPPA